MEWQGSGFELRPWRPGDEASLAENANDPSVWRNLGAEFPHPYRLEDARYWIAEQQAGRGRTGLDLAICVDGRAVGGIGCHPQGGVFACRATVGYWLGRPYWGRGIASRALARLSEHALRSLDLARLDATVYEWNLASCRVLEKAGYVREARLRKSAVKEGRIIDTFLYARVKPDEPGA